MASGVFEKAFPSDHAVTQHIIRAILKFLANTVSRAGQQGHTFFTTSLAPSSPSRKLRFFPPLPPRLRDNSSRGHFLFRSNLDGQHLPPPSFSYPAEGRWATDRVSPRYTRRRPFKSLLRPPIITFLLSSFFVLLLALFSPPIQVKI